MIRQNSHKQCDDSKSTPHEISFLQLSFWVLESLSIVHCAPFFRQRFNLDFGVIFVLPSLGALLLFTSCVLLTVTSSVFWYEFPHFLNYLRVVNFFNSRIRWDGTQRKRSAIFSSFSKVPRFIFYLEMWEKAQSVFSINKRT